MCGRLWRSRGLVGGSFLLLRWRWRFPWLWKGPFFFRTLPHPVGGCSRIRTTVNLHRHRDQWTTCRGVWWTFCFTRTFFLRRYRSLLRGWEWRGVIHTGWGCAGCWRRWFFFVKDLSRGLWCRRRGWCCPCRVSWTIVGLLSCRRRWPSRSFRGLTIGWITLWCIIGRTLYLIRWLLRLCWCPALWMPIGFIIRWRTSYKCRSLCLTASGGLIQVRLRVNFRNERLLSLRWGRCVSWWWSFCYWAVGICLRGRRGVLLLFCIRLVRLLFSFRQKSPQRTLPIGYRGCLRSLI